MNAQKNRPSVSSTCQNRPRSRYSQPCIPNRRERRRGAPVDVEQLPDHAAEHDHGEGAQQAVREPVTAGAVPGPRRSGRGRGRRPGTTSPSRRSPAARARCAPGCRAASGEVEAEEAGDVGAVVLAGGTDHGLDDEEQTDDEEEVGAGPLRRREQHVTGWAEGDRVGLPALPSQPFAPAAEGREQRADTGQQGDQGEHAPHHDVGGGLVADERLRRPVVGVGVVLARPQRRAGPCRPGEVRRELPDLGPRR